MKKLRLTFLIGLISLMLVIQTAQAAWQALGWAVFREIVIDTAIDTVQDLFKDKVEPEEVEALNQRVSALDTQLAAYQKQGNYPSLEEFNTIKQLITSVNHMVNTMANRLGSVEKRVTQLEQEIALLRQALLTLPRTRNGNKGLKGIKNDPLDFKINSLYRAGGKGNFKPISKGSVLHSGDYYKIIFTPVEDSYVYIFQVDSANKLFRLFPIKGFGDVTVNHVNPVKGGKTYYVPSQHQSFELDEQTGIETIYFVAARQNDIVLDSQYQAISLAEQQNNLAKTQRVQVQLINSLRDGKGAKQRLVNDVAGVKTTWQEDGQYFSVLQKSLEEMCNGCVEILTFEHR